MYSSQQSHYHTKANAFPSKPESNNLLRGLSPQANYSIIETSSHIFYTFDSQMTVRLSALRAGRSLPQEDPWYLFLLESESTPGP
jgi:hypothetical protein